MAEQVLINGPINVVRLEGNIFGIYKVIYLFFDYHAPINGQINCDDYNATDIEQFLYKKLAHIDKPIDFIVEILKKDMSLDKSKYHQIHINQVRKLFTDYNNSINSNKKSTKNKKNIDNNSLNNSVSKKIIDKSSDNINIRLHYLDIRDIVQNKIVNIIDNLDRLYNGLAYTDDDILSTMLQLLKQLKSEFNIVLNMMTGKYKKTPEQILKLLYKYTHKKLLDVFQIIFNKITNLINTILNKIDELIHFVSTTLEKYKTLQTSRIIYEKDDIFNVNYGAEYFSNLKFKRTIIDIHDIINILTRDVFTHITDMYFLRRLLDKDYITNAIVYSGAAHSIFYIHFLVHYFDFAVTHASYSSIDIDKLNKIIKKNNYNKIFDYLLPPEQLQCVNMSHFPDNFK